MVELDVMESHTDRSIPLIRELSEDDARDPSLFTAVIVDMLTTGTAVKFTAVGRSMLPVICANDQLTVVPRSAAAIRRGDVALYRRDGGLTAHRVLAFSVRVRMLVFACGGMHPVVLLMRFLLRMCSVR